MNMRSELVITETSPTPIVKDFSVFSKYVAENEILLTKSQGWLTRKNLLAINALMTEPERNVTTYSDQNAYPLMSLFYHLGLTAKLFRIVQLDRDRKTLLPTDRLPIFNSMNAIEKYMSLLETFWVDADWKDIADNGSSLGSFLSTRIIFDYLEQFPPGHVIDLSENSDSRKISNLFWRWGYLIHYFNYFGFWQTTKDIEKSAQFGGKFHYEIKTLSLTPLFQMLGRTLIHSRDLDYWNLFERREAGNWWGAPGDPLTEEEDTDEWITERFIQSFLPLFPSGELTRTLPRSTGVFFDGTYKLKVSVRQNCWRLIQLSSYCTLYDLHQAIQKAFDFGDDHLYAFFMDGEIWSSKQVFYSPDADDEPTVLDAQLGELDLSIGQSFLYLFDFGDEWEFAVIVEEALTIDTHDEKPQVIEWKGNPPEQYRY